jgi:uncharacterized protein YecE (DUF72 family)
VLLALGFPAAKAAQCATLYYRFHGVPDLYASCYSGEALRRYATEVTAAPGMAQAYLYFTNDIDGAAIGNAQEMRSLL